MGVLALTVALPANASAQRDTSPFLRANVISGAATGGLGAIVNRARGESWPRALLRGAAAGALGGWLQYQGKRQALRMSERDHLEYAWLARTLHAAGSSIIENAAADRPAFESFRFNLGFVRLDLDLRTRDVQARLLPAALVSTVQMSQWGRLDARRSLRTGILTFTTHHQQDRVRGLAVTRVNTVLYVPWVSASSLSEVLAHELIHTLQYDDYAGTTLLAKPLSRSAEDWPLARTLSRWVYPDLHAGIDAFFYEVLNGGASGCTNAHEREAYTLSARWSYC